MSFPFSSKVALQQRWRYMASSEAERQSHMTTDGEDGNYITEVAG